MFNIRQCLWTGVLAAAVSLRKTITIPISLNHMLRKGLKLIRNIQYRRTGLEHKIYPVTPKTCRSQWSRGLRHRSAAPTCWDCGFESHPLHRCLSVVNVVCCQVDVSATSWPLVQRSPTDCGVSLCDLETSWMGRLWPTGGCRAK